MALDMALPMVTCPLCCRPGFNTSNALCSALMSASTRKLCCPICNEEVTGLAKLSAHLAEHSELVTSCSESKKNNNGVNDVIPLEVKASTHPEISPISILYIRSDDGQIYAIPSEAAPGQLNNVTINTQNFISNTCVSSHKELTVSPPKKEFESCKDLLAKGDFSSMSGDIYPTIHSSTAESSTLDSNQLNLEESIANELVCDICDLSFANKTILAVHKQLLHKNMKSEDSFTDAQKALLKANRKIISCPNCPRTFNLKSSLLIHIKVSHSASKETDPSKKDPPKSTCSTCGKSFNKESSLVQHMKTHGEKHWQCSECLKSFTTKYFLRKHKRIHTGETPYECTICHKVFTFQQSYHKHMLYHSSHKPYCCSHCGRLFKELSTLNNHERIHSGEKPFTCETCGKAFRQRVSYLVHRRIHTGVMPYKCTACNRAFRYKISQRTHKCPEQPPGVVVKTQTSLVDRLQAVIKKENALQLGAPQNLEVTAPLETTANILPSAALAESLNNQFVPQVSSDSSPQEFSSTEVARRAGPPTFSENVVAPNSPMSESTVSQLLSEFDDSHCNTGIKGFDISDLFNEYDCSVDNSCSILSNSPETSSPSDGLGRLKISEPVETVEHLLKSGSSDEKSMKSENHNYDICFDAVADDVIRDLLSVTSSIDA